MSYCPVKDFIVRATLPPPPLSLCLHEKRERGTTAKQAKARVKRDHARLVENQEQRTPASFDLWLRE